MSRVYLLKTLLLPIAMMIVQFAGCQAWLTNDMPDRIRPSNSRKWSPQFSQLPTAEFDGPMVRLKNVRNNRYVTEEDFILAYEDRTVDLEKIQGVDFLVCPFKNDYLAHTMLSFEFEADTPNGPRPEFVAVSAEIRTEDGEAYSPMLGITNQFEMTYVVADEKDLIRLRTRHRNAEVFIYPTRATPEQARELFIDVMTRVNRLSVKPEFYHTLANNCTTSIVKHVNAISPNRVPYNYSILLPGLSARYAYDLGLLDTSVPFSDLKKRSNVTRLSEANYDDPDYSLRIRER